MTGSPGEEDQTGARPPASSWGSPLAGLLVAALRARPRGRARDGCSPCSSAPSRSTLLPVYPPLVAVAAVAPGCSSRGLVVVAGHARAVVPALGAAPVPPPPGRPAPAGRGANLYVRQPRPGGERCGRCGRCSPTSLVVPELTAAGLAALRASGLLADLPHGAVAGTAGDESVGLFSRLPLTGVELQAVGDAGAAARDRRRRRPAGAACSPPTRCPRFRLGGPVARTCSRPRGEVARRPLPVVVAGDLNADRDDARLPAAARGRSRDAHDERGRGLARTWPAGRPSCSSTTCWSATGRAPGSRSSPSASAACRAATTGRWSPTSPCSAGDRRPGLDAGSRKSTCLRCAGTPSRSTAPTPTGWPSSGPSCCGSRCAAAGSSTSGLEPVAPGLPRLVFQQVDDPRPAKTTVHLDLHVTGPELLDAAVARAVALGRQRGPRERAGGADLATLADPEGNLFCLVSD